MIRPNRGSKDPRYSPFAVASGPLKRFMDSFSLLALIERHMGSSQAIVDGEENCWSERFPGALGGMLGALGGAGLALLLVWAIGRWRKRW